MTKNYSLKDIRDFFINIEKKYLVYDLKYKEIFYWKLLRKDLFDAIVRLTGILDEGHPMSKIDKIKRGMLLLIYSTINMFNKRNLKKSDIMLLTHGRKCKINNKYVDIYLYDILNDLKKKNLDLFILDRPDHYGKHYKIEEVNFLYYERFAHLFREGLFQYSIDENELLKSEQIIFEIENEINSKFNIDIDLMRLVKRKLFKYENEKKYFDKILDRVRPDKVIMVVSYGKEELIASAKERNIETIEVQHGVISSYHMGYYFPFEFPIPYFPDELILFGEYWKQSVKFPINSRQIVNSFSFMKHNHIRVINEKKMNKVLFISQGSIGIQLSKIAANFAYKEQIDCYYKLHPSEFNNWRNRYSELSKCEIDGRIKVISNQNSIYELFNLCKYVIGVYSTAIYESLMYECKTFVVKIEGYQYMEYLIDKNYVKLLSTDFCLNDLYDFQENKLENKGYFYI